MKIPSLRRRPAAPPAPVADPASAGHDRLKAWCLHLRALALDLAGQPGLSPAQTALLRAYADDLDSTLGAHPLNFDLRLYLARGEDDTLRPVLNELRAGPPPHPALLAAVQAAEAALATRARPPAHPGPTP